MDSNEGLAVATSAIVGTLIFAGGAALLGGEDAPVGGAAVFGALIFGGLTFLSYESAVKDLPAASTSTSTGTTST